MKRLPLVASVLLASVLPKLGAAQSPPSVPDRQIPPSVLAELRLLENRFESALAQDCAPERCFFKGCTYGDHTVADRPRSSALPGLAEERGPGSVAPQEYLTLARCSFAHERSLSTRDGSALVRRLQTKLSTGWTVVEVSRQRLQPISPELREAPEPPEPEAPVVEEPVAPPPEPPVPSWEFSTAMRELWVSLLPHFAWMIAVVMVTIAAMLLIWGWRRLGRISPEEQALLAQMTAAPAEEPEEEEAMEPEVVSSPPEPAKDDTFVREQRVYWSERLDAQNGEADPDVRELIAQWLKAHELGLLAKAVLTFPKHFPVAFPDGGEYAESKLRFSEYLRDVSVSDLPSDEVFYAQLKQHALSASLAGHADTRGMASLRADFGAAGLVRFIAALPPRYGALLFAHASIDDQFEAARLLSPSQVADLGEQLLQSNRMSRAEAGYLVELLAASKSGEELPPPPRMVEVTDVGSTFDAASALSILLPVTEPAERSALFANAKDRFGGAFPGWYKEILFPELLLELTDEARANLLLETDVLDLAGWLSALPANSRKAVLAGMSTSLSSAVQASSVFGSRAEQLKRYHQGRLQLASGLQRTLARSSTSFEALMV